MSSTGVDEKKSSSHPSSSSNSKDERLKDTKKSNIKGGSGSVINAAFDPETRRKIASITKISEPTLVDERKQSEVEHPLLSLHQSVTATSSSSNTVKTANGNRRSTEKKSREEDQKVKEEGVKSTNTENKSTLNETSSKNPESKPSRNTATTSDSRPTNPKPNKKMEEKQKIVTKKKPLASILFKVISTIVLLNLWLSLLQSVIHNNPSVEQNAPKALLDILAKTSAVQFAIGSFAQDLGKQFVSSTNKQVDSIQQQQIDQFEKRLVVGQNLLRKYSDASGSATACERTLYAILDGSKNGGQLSAENTQRESLSLSISSLITSLNVDQSRLVVQALLCVGEARLALYSSPLGSDNMRGAQLIQAKDSYEAATSVDPTNPSVRSGLGLSYLLLGMKEREGSNDSMQFIYQSIQHLKASVGMTFDLESGDTANDDEIAVVQTAAMHNLGLAYIALDGMSSSVGGKSSQHFLDWVALLRKSQSHNALLESWVFSMNEGALLLQSGKIEEAVSSLEITAGEVCSDTPSSSRQNEACLIVQQNLIVAKEALSGEQDTTIIRKSEGGASTLDVVVQWNVDVSSGILAQAESSDTIANATTPSEDDNNATSASSEEETGEDTQTQPDKTAVEEQAKEDEVIDLPPAKKVKPEMQNALAALEKAANEGPQRTRVLLALARARSSAGDSAGAVDAAVKAISAANSDEESETASAYLEKLMEKMSEDEDTVQVVEEKEKHALEKSQKPSSFVESKDFALTELQLKLELERLKYKVLEQEMKLAGRLQHPSQYADEKMRAIDYQREDDDIDHDPPLRRNTDKSEENIPVNKATTKPLKHETKVDEIEPETSVDEVEVNTEPALTEETDDSDSQVSGGNEATVDSEFIANNETASSIEAVPADATDGVESVQSESVPEESESSINATETAIDEEPVEVVEAIELPSLYQPTLTSPKAIPPTAKSYMKMADAYLDKRQYPLASKQFLKVMKKAPDHLPAYLGYATALERAGKSKQITTAALAYGNATKVAIMQGERVDPMAKAGAGGIAENIMRRAVQIAKSAPSERLETLQSLSKYAHTAIIAADIFYEIGREISKQGMSTGDNKADAAQAFMIANEFIATRNDTENPYHIGSIVELAKIALEQENDAARVIDLYSQVKNAHMEDSLHVEMMVLVGRAHASRGEIETAITEFTRALSLPQSASTPSAHHELAIALKNNSGDSHEINLHFEKALDLGMDPTQEAIDSLGERNMSLMRALNRQYYKSYNSGGAESSGGGIMSGGGVGAQSTSVFAPQPKQQDAASAQSDTLTLLEQGAASYDGHNPMGGAVEGAESNLQNLKAKKETKESNLNTLRR